MTLKIEAVECKNNAKDLKICWAFGLSENMGVYLPKVGVARIFTFMEGPKRPDIQQCKDVIKNVLDYGMDVRQPVIRKALAQLNPVPSHWEKSRSAASITETAPTSVDAEETRSSKSRKR